jgi:transcriptional regulator GlxA family with amidase domain
MQFFTKTRNDLIKQETMSGSLLSGEDFTGRLNAISKDRHADHNFGVSALAREMEMSRSTLHRKMKQAFNCSASRYISQRRLENARQLLQNKKFTIKKIAFLCGFHSATYFNKCFHGYYGFPPGEARKK